MQNLRTCNFRGRSVSDLKKKQTHTNWLYYDWKSVAEILSQVLCVLLTDIVMICPAVVCHHILMTVRLWTHFRISLPDCPPVRAAGDHISSDFSYMHSTEQSMGTSWGQGSDGKPRPARKTTHTEVPTMATKTSKWFQKATKLVTLGLNHETALKIWHLVSATAVPLLAGVVRCVVSQLKVFKKKKSSCLMFPTFLKPVNI